MTSLSPAADGSLAGNAKPLRAKTPRASALRAKPLLAALALASALATAAFAPAPALADDADPVLARVNGTEIKASDVAAAEEEIGANLPPMAPDARKDYVLTLLTDTTLVAQAAEAKKLADTTAFKTKLAFARNRLLSEALLSQEGKAALTDEAMHKVYDEAVKQMGTEKEVRARHILVETEDEAKAVLAELKKGADFAELAKKKSKDPGGAEGGDLGYFTKEQMVPEFAEVAFKLEPGKLSDPVKSQFGWHIIKVEDKRDKPIPTFDKVKDQIESFLTRKSQAELVSKLRKEAKIERTAAAPKPAAPEAPAAAPAEPKKQ
ncbi:MAG: peptidylprolyl isomerase [Variibacter sp.]